MFKKGETVYYGTAGVCVVSDICRSPFDKNDDRMYYVLAPKDFDNGTVIYAPADNAQVVIRPIMTAEDANALIGSISELESLEVVNDKHRRDEYRNALRSGDPLTLAKIVKSVYTRKKSALKTQKKISDTDTEFDKLARKALFGELCAALGKENSEIECAVNSALAK